MVALRKLPVCTRRPGSSSAAERDSILKSFGVTAAQVESTSVRLAG